MVRGIAERDRLPGYHVSLLDEDAGVAFVARDG
jgi:hypothetical protein